MQNMTIGNWIQQGDVTLTPVTEIPTDAVKQQWDGIIAEGEQTGHRHKLMGHADKFTTPNGDEYLSVPKRIVLAHEKGGAVADHHPDPVPAGLYKIGSVRQFNYASREVERVTD